MSTTRVHVNQHRIKRNAKTGERAPVLTAKQGRRNRYGNRVEILGDDGEVIAAVRYEPDRPLSCGARCWVETERPVRVRR